MIRLFRRHRETPVPELPRPVWATPHGPPPPPAAWRARAGALDDGAALDPDLVAALADETTARAATVVAGWTVPRLSGLRVRRDGLPDWWTVGGNLLLAAPDVPLPRLDIERHAPPTGGLAVLSAGSVLYGLTLGHDNAFVMVGDEARLPLVGLQSNEGTVLVGTRCAATAMSHIDARNGGAVLIGDETIFGAGTRIITDDMHAIRDRATGRRINPRGGRVAIGRHVWIGEQVLIQGESAIGDDAVLGSQSTLKGRALPPHSVSSGRPARVGRTGTTWTIEDLP